MPENFYRIFFKWLGIKLALGFIIFPISSYLINFSTSYEVTYIINIIFGISNFLIFSLVLGFGIRELLRTNHYNISVSSVFIFSGLMVLIPQIISTGIMYFRAFTDENLSEIFERGYIWYSIFVSFFSQFILALIVITVASQWRLFKKAGRKGYLALIPIVNMIVLTEIANKNTGLVALLFIPLLNIFAFFIILRGLTKTFDKSDAFTWGLFFLPFIFFPILGFESDGEYRWVPPGREDILDDNFEAQNNDLV
jgi:hypothetical protein